MKRRQLKGVLIRFGPRVTQKQRVVGMPRRSTEFIGQFLLLRNMNRVGIERDLVQLAGQRLYVAGVRMANRNHGVTTVQIKILGAVGIPKIATLRPNGFDVVERINVKKLGH